MDVGHIAGIQVVRTVGHSQAVCQQEVVPVPVLVLVLQREQVLGSSSHCRLLILYNGAKDLKVVSVVEAARVL